MRSSRLLSFFITFEGVEGCGKSTQAQMLARHLAKRGVKVFITREPGGTPIGDSIRKVLLSPKNESMNRYAELYLYLAARTEHILKIITPKLQEGVIVICDRFTDATRAYQGYGRKIPLSLINKLHAGKPLSLRPDITFLLDVDPAIGLRRARKRNSQKGTLRQEGRFEDEPLGFHRRVRDGYLKIARKDKKRVRIINGSGSIGNVHREVLAHMDRFLRDRRGKEDHGLL